MKKTRKSKNWIISLIILIILLVLIALALILAFKPDVQDKNTTILLQFKLRLCFAVL